MSDPVTTPADELITDPTNEPIAATAGEQDHVDPDTFRGEDADAPEDAGRPADDTTEDTTDDDAEDAG